MGRGALAIKRPGVVVSVVFVATVLLDQATKALVRSRMELHESIEIIGSFLRLTYVRNTGAAFGMLPGYRPIFLTISTLVLIGIVIYWFRYRPSHPAVVIALGLLAAGAFGNLIDRGVVGRVTDFIEFPHFPVFNVADSAIVIGVSILVWWLLFGPESKHLGPADAEAAAGETVTAEASGPAAGMVEEIERDLPASGIVDPTERE